MTTILSPQNSMSNANGVKGAANFPPPREGDVVTCRHTKRAFQVTEVTATKPQRVKLISVAPSGNKGYIRDMVNIALIWEYYIPNWR